MLTKFLQSRFSRLSTVQPHEALFSRRKWCTRGLVRFSYKTGRYCTLRHTSYCTPDSHSLHIPGFWEKGKWPGNPPDLIHLKNLWKFLKQELDFAPPSTSVAELTARLKVTWVNISWSTLNWLVDSVPQRVARCSESKEEYVGTKNMSVKPITIALSEQERWERTYGTPCTLMPNNMIILHD